MVVFVFAGRGGMALVQVKEEVEAEAYLGETPACDVRMQVSGGS